MTYTWNHQGAVVAAPMSAMGTESLEERTKRLSARSAPAMLARSPSGWASPWNADGATAIGVAKRSPYSSTEVSTDATLRSGEGRTRNRAHALVTSDFTSGTGGVVLKDFWRQLGVRLCCLLVQHGQHIGPW
jgi:hypothetical protein